MNGLDPARHIYTTFSCRKITLSSELIQNRACWNILIFQHVLVTFKFFGSSVEYFHECAYTTTFCWYVIPNDLSTLYSVSGRLAAKPVIYCWIAEKYMLAITVLRPKSVPSLIGRLQVFGICIVVAYSWKYSILDPKKLRPAAWKCLIFRCLRCA